MKPMMTRKVKHGGYSAVLSVIVVVAVIIINMIAGQIPQHLKSIDVSGTNLFDISDTTKDVLNGLQQDVNLYIVSDPNKIDNRVQILVNLYSQMSPHIKVEKIDTVLHPAWLGSHGAEDQSLFVTSETTGKKVSIPFSDIVKVDQMSYYYYGQYKETEFDGEGQLTSAIASVSSNVVKNIYEMTGHAEAALSDNVKSMMSKSGLDVKSVNLLTDEGIPEDTDLLICNAPVNDFANDEKKLILDYLDQGGHMVLLAGPSQKDRPNLKAVMEAYGLTLEDGLVADLSQNYQRNPYAVFPTCDPTSVAMKGVDSKAAALILKGTAMIQSENVPEGVTVEPFMTTSDHGVLVDGDTQTAGKYLLGARAEKELDSGSAVLTVITAPTLISDQITAQFTNLSNLDIFMNAVTADFKDVNNISIPAKSLAVTYNTFKDAGIYGIIFIVLIPLIVLICGFTIWTKRRKL